MSKNKKIDFYVGMTIGIFSEECIGTITKITGKRIYIESDVFSGWMNKSEFIRNPELQEK